MKNQRIFLIKFLLGLGIFLLGWIKPDVSNITDDKKAPDNALAHKEILACENPGANQDVHLFVSCSGFIS